jgi:type I restriction enzyme S subunit
MMMAVPEIRFAGFTDPWEQRKLGDVSQLNPTAIDLCQYFGHKNLRFYAAIAIAFSIGFVRSKNASIASAGIL